MSLPFQTIAVAQQGPLMVLADVPALADQGPAFDRLELVAPDSSGHEPAHEPGREPTWPALPGDAAILFELDHGGDHGVPDARLHGHSEVGAQAELVRGTGFGLLDGAGAIDIGVAGGIGDQREDGCWSGGYHPFDRYDVSVHVVLLVARRAGTAWSRA